MSRYHCLSDGILRVERGAVRLLAMLLMIIAVIGAHFALPSISCGELAIHCMVWIAAIGMSLTLKTRTAVSVTMPGRRGTAALMKSMKVLIDVIILTVAGILIYLLHREWFRPRCAGARRFRLPGISRRTFNHVPGHHQHPGHEEILVLVDRAGRRDDDLRACALESVEVARRLPRRRNECVSAQDSTDVYRSYFCRPAGLRRADRAGAGRHRPGDTIYLSGNTVLYLSFPQVLYGSMEATA